MPLPGLPRTGARTHDLALVHGSLPPTIGSVVGLAGSPTGQGPFLAVDALLGPRPGDITFGTGYCLLPWMGVMAAGYGLGKLMLLDRDRPRDKVDVLSLQAEQLTPAKRAVGGDEDE